jgi:hypothetical protein
MPDRLPIAFYLLPAGNRQLAVARRRLRFLTCFEARQPSIGFVHRDMQTRGPIFGPRSERILPELFEAFSAFPI